MGFLGDAASSVLNGGGHDNSAPSFKGVQTDQQTNSAIDNYNNYAKNTDFAQQTMQGTDKSQAVSSPDEIQRQQTALGNPNAGAMSNAIAAKQRNAYQKSSSNLNTQANLAAPQMKMQALQQAEQAMYAKEQTNYQYAQGQLQSNLNQVAARNQVLTSIFGGVGAFAGGAAGALSGGGAAGTQQGAKIGQSSTTSGFGKGQ